MSVVDVSPLDDEFKATLSDADSILLLDGEDGISDEVCSSLLSLNSGHNRALLSITFDDTPDERLGTWRAHNGDLPAEIGVIAMGETTRSAVDTASQGPDSQSITVDAISGASDLTGLAIAIGNYLDEWASSPVSPVVCFDSITSLLFHTDESRVFRFVHTTTARLQAVGAVAHYHLNPKAFDDSTVNTFSGLFDAVVEIEGIDAVRVRKRL